MLRITPHISIDETELHVEFVRSSGPGGQNVNKVATAVQLRFDVANSPSLAPDVKHRLAKIAGSRLTDGGVLIVDARRHRSQKLNREDAMERLADMIRAAAIAPKRRRKTRPTFASKQRRLEDKSRRSAIKRLRRDSQGE